jgi:hypothetical protein
VTAIRGLFEAGRFSSMTGTIKSLDVASATGAIKAEQGLIVGFLLSSVMTYDLPILAVGQVVGFDLADGRCPKALNIYVLGAPQTVTAKDKRLDNSPRLRYVGFEHRGNTRAYLFEKFVPGTEKRTFAVDTDLALFARHHVAMQEGPALCLQLLVDELDAEGTTAPKSFKCALSDREMLAYLASRPVPRSKYGSKRTLPPSGADSRVV